MEILSHYIVLALPVARSAMIASGEGPRVDLPLRIFSIGMTENRGMHRGRDELEIGLLVVSQLLGRDPQKPGDVNVISRRILLQFHGAVLLPDVLSATDALC